MFMSKITVFVPQSTTCLTADTGVKKSIPARSLNFLEFDHENQCMAIIIPSAVTRRFIVSYVVKYKPKYVQEVLVIHLITKLAQEKSVVS